MGDIATDRVLLIDDSEIDLFIEQRLLNVLEFSKELITYKSAQEALNNLAGLQRNQWPGVIFLDLNMPNIDGYMFLDQFEGLPDPIKETTKVVILTSSNSKIDRERVFRHKNVVHFITKPLNQMHVEELRTIIGGIA